MVTMTLYAKQQKRHRDKNRLLDSVGGEGGMILENGIETCILSYVKQITSPGLMHETGCSGLVHWDDPEGCDGEGQWDCWVIRQFYFQFFKESPHCSP